MRHLMLALTWLAVSSALTAAAQAERRVALVIGNGAYQHTPILTNPGNDAADMAAALKQLGFLVIAGRDLDKTQMDRTIQQFAEALSGAEMGLFFYAGHGLQVGSANYLVPIDAKLSTAHALDFEMVRLDLVQRVMEGATQTNVIFLDACRDNPLSRNLARALGTRSTSIGRGLAQVEAGLGTLISYATHPGAVAADGAGRNSPYTTSLKARILTAGEDLTSVLIGVRNDVLAATAGKQVPWDQHALRARLYLMAAPVASLPVPSAAEIDAARKSIEAERAKAEAELAKRDAELKRLTDELKRSEDERKKVASVVPPPPPAPAPRVKLDAIAELTPGSGRSARDRLASSGECAFCPEMVVVPAGHFMMGSPESEAGREKDEGPQRRVAIVKAFAVGKFEVTFAEWDACVEDKGCAYKPETRWGRGRQPVHSVSWDDAKAYVAWLSRVTGKNYRLLSEAEWEYAARATSTTPFSTGRTITTDQANFNGTTYGGSAKGENRQRPVEVGSFRPNVWGLHDMHGNVWEWVEDCHDSYEGAPSDGTPRTTTRTDASGRVVRGGSWSSDPYFLRSGFRLWNSTDLRYIYFGYRLARTLNP